MWVPLKVGVSKGNGWCVDSVAEVGGRLAVKDSWRGIISLECPSFFSLGKSLLIFRGLSPTTGWSHKARSSFVMAKDSLMRAESPEV